MSGHSKWSQIKRQKGAADVKRSGVFTKLSNAIAVAVREGGKQPDMNFKLRLAIDRAKAANMPNDNIDRAIKRGAGEGEGALIETVTYEGFGPAGSALVIEAMTDNKNRTASELRSLLSSAGGSLGSPNSVRWQFQTKGAIDLLIDQNANLSLEAVESAAIEAGADDVIQSDSVIEILTDPQHLQRVKESIEKLPAVIDTAELRNIPTTPIDLSEADREKLLTLLHELDELADIDSVSTNANL